ncbi:hypothetical protein BDN70DRAFT_763119, partial [Pholiota conissans]
QVPRGTYSALQRNASQVKQTGRAVAKPIVITVLIEGKPARALLDTGSLGDFISSTLVDQLHLKRELLEKPMPLQLAVTGSRSKINAQTRANFKYEGINEDRVFDIMNISQYDLILGTAWLYQHSITLGFNPIRVNIGSTVAQPLVGKPAISEISSRAVRPTDAAIEAAREELLAYAEPLCKTAAETELPPLRTINHSIPLIDPNLIYPWRPSRCPEAFRQQWAEKRDAYLKSGRWKITTSGNTVPMMLIPKPRIG